MGQQQLLLIILGVIVVGIAVAVGITMFNDSAVSANRDAVTNDLVNLASRAQQFYRRPIALGGGGGSFAALSAANGMKLLTKTTTTQMTNGNGKYFISTAGSATDIIFTGTGTETGNDNSQPVTVVMHVWADSAKVDVTAGN
jgi:Tfp pilus assembly protein PilE